MRTEQQKEIRRRLADLINSSYFAQYIAEDSKETSKTTKKMIINRLQKIRDITREIEVLTER